MNYGCRREETTRRGPAGAAKTSGGIAVDTWVHQQVRAVCRRRVAFWCVVLGCAVLFALSQARYIKNFVGGPFDFGEPELDAIGDVSTAPRYFVKVTGSKAIETGIQQITTRKRAGVETGRS